MINLHVTYNKNSNNLNGLIKLRRQHFCSWKDFPKDLFIGWGNAKYPINGNTLIRNKKPVLTFQAV